MVEDAMVAYADRDADACFEISERDNEVDASCVSASETVVRDLIETELETRDRSEADTERFMEEVSRLLLTIRDLERVGDHAVNIAARTLYMVENDEALIY
jgi:phosphate transport system protein